MNPYLLKYVYRVILRRGKLDKGSLLKTLANFLTNFVKDGSPLPPLNNRCHFSGRRCVEWSMHSLISKLCVMVDAISDP